jgi:translation initiation factor IF-3
MNSLRLFSYSFRKNLSNETIIFNKYLLNNNTLKTSNFNYTINVKTPANSHKVFRPSTIAVTNANKHLIVNLFDQSNTDLGKMSMEKAKELSLKGDLKLVIIDESTKPPKFKLMNGNELYQLQLKHRDEKRAEKETGNKFLKEKEVDINLGISDHDLDVKVKMIHNFYEKGNPIKIKIKSLIAGKNVSFFS